MLCSFRLMVLLGVFMFSNVSRASGHRFCSLEDDGRVRSLGLMLQSEKQLPPKASNNSSRASGLQRSVHACLLRSCSMRYACRADTHAWCFRFEASFGCTFHATRPDDCTKTGQGVPDAKISRVFTSRAPSASGHCWSHVSALLVSTSCPPARSCTA